MISQSDYIRFKGSSQNFIPKEVRIDPKANREDYAKNNLVIYGPARVQLMQNFFVFQQDII